MRAKGKKTHGLTDTTAQPFFSFQLLLLIESGSKMDVNTTVADLNNVESLNDAELKKLYDEFEKKVNMMELENSVFESHLNRVNPSVLKGEGENDNINGNNAKDAGNSNQGGAGKDQGRRDDRLLKKKRGDKAKENEVVILLTAEQKSEVANREVEEMKDEIDREKERWEKVTDNLKVLLRVTTTHNLKLSLLPLGWNGRNWDKDSGVQETLIGSQETGAINEESSNGQSHCGEIDSILWRQYQDKGINNSRMVWLFNADNTKSHIIYLGYNHWKD